MTGHVVRGAIAIVVFFGCLSLVAVATIVLGALLGGRVVITNSIPRGLYRVESHRVVRGEYAGGCLPIEVATTAARLGYALHGRCPGNVLAFVKVVAAVEGDRIEETAAGVRVNGRWWPCSAPLRIDRSGRRMVWSARSFTVAKGAVLLLGLNPSSYDGRYFGETPRDELDAYRPIAIEAPVCQEARVRDATYARAAPRGSALGR